LAVSATVFWAALLVTASRAAILAALLAVACTAACAGWQARDGKLRRVFTRAVATMGALVVLVAGLAAWSPSLSDHKLAPDRLVTTYSMQNRMQHWRIAYEGWLQRPLLGWGPDGFQHLKVEEVCAWRHERGEICNPAQYVETKHAHSLYMATLAERGIVGMAALAFLVALWAWSLACTARSAASSSWWAASAVGLAVVVVGGLFNTTLRVEHGSLAAVFFGLWIAAHGRGSRPASRSA
jgi:O-antigen ligase